MVAKVVPAEATEANPVPVSDNSGNNFLWRILQILLAPLGYDKSLKRYRQTAIIENAVGVGNIATIDGRQGSMLINAQSRASWALNVRSRIT